MSDDPVDLDAERKKRLATLSLLTSKKMPWGERCIGPCAWEVDEKTRTVACRKCKRMIEPFDCILELAKDFEGYAQNRTLLRKEVEVLRRNEEGLRASIKTLKAAERRLLKDWRVISAAIADHVVAFVPKEHKYARVASSIAHYIRRWRPEEVMPALAPKPEAKSGAGA